MQKQKDSYLKTSLYTKTQKPAGNFPPVFGCRKQNSS
jgi:hypothetical protein